MQLFVIDGNSILNRAFYGIKLLTTKDGRFTNAIVGFMNILLKLEEEYAPQAVAVAFDLSAPTFRHTLYTQYKAGRKGMPEELAQQLPVLKQLLELLGYRIVEQAGYEADDILGTLAFQSASQNCGCYLVTGDRDSLQLVSETVSVLLTSTKMGRPQTVCYDPQQVKEEYGVTPKELIEVKALMGDSSDNIPGVAGVGKKTAEELIARFHSIDAIYTDLDAPDIKPGVREKLRGGRDSAYLSRDLGTICLEVPIETRLEHYRKQQPDVHRAAALLADLELFRLIERLGFIQNAQLTFTGAQAEKQTQPAVQVREESDMDFLLTRLRSDKQAIFTVDAQGNFYFALGDAVVLVCAENARYGYLLEELLENGEIRKYTQKSKGLCTLTMRHGLVLQGLAGDTALAAYVLNPNANDYGTQRLAQEYGVSLQEGPESVPAREAAVLPELFRVLHGKIEEREQNDLLFGIELPLSCVLAQMEESGFAVDRDGIVQFGQILAERIAETEETVFDAVGYRFNLNSPKQLGEALFEKLQLPTGKKTKTGYSTNAEVLESLAAEHPAVAKVLEYRTLAKLKATYCDGLVKEIAADGRIHSTLHQTETRTGRISSAEPNLQNIPVRSELGSQLRRFFRAKSGHVLVDADYSQIELRVLAHIAQDEAMLAAFNEGVDIHTVTASQVFGLPPERVTPLMRSRAKAVNFGIVYGIGAFSLAQDIGVSRYEAGQYISEYLRHYAGVNRYMEQVVEQAKTDGFVQTLYGRRRYLPELSASNFNMRAFGERVARNMPIQGTAADIIKLAMIRVSKRLREEHFAAKLILQVHDELIVEAPCEEAEAAAVLLKEEMENAAQLSVRLTADVHIGETWYDAKGNGG